MEEEEVLQQEQVTQTDPKKEVKQQTPQEFSAKIKSKYPQYKDMDDVELAQKIVAKYPQYEGVVNFDVKKKELSNGTSPNQKLDSEAKDTDGLSATSQNKDIPVTFGADGLEQTTFLNKESRDEQFADTVNASIEDSFKAEIEPLLNEYQAKTEIKQEDIDDVENTIKKEESGEFGLLNNISNFANRAWTGTTPANKRQIGIYKTKKELAKAEGVSVDEINDVEAEKIYTENRKAELINIKKQEKTEEFIEDLGEEGQAKLNKHFNVKANKLNNKSKALLLNIESDEKELNNVGLQYESIVNELNEINKVHDDTKQYEPEYYQKHQDLRDQALKLESQIKDLGKSLQLNAQEFSESKEDLLSTQEEIDLFKRNYSKLDNFTGKFNIAAGDLGLGLAYIMNKGVGINPIYKASSLALENKIIEGKEFLEEKSEGLRKGKSVDNINSWEDATEWALDLVATQGPNTILMATTGGASLPLMGATTAGNKLYELDKSNAEGTTNYSELEKYASAFITGTAEALSEKVSLGQIGMAKRAFSSVSKNKLKESTLSYLKRAFPKYAKDTFEEGGTEVLSQLAENITDKYLLGNKEVNLTDGLKESFISGVFMSGVIYKSPGIARDLITPFIPKDVNQKIGENFEKIVVINSQLNNDINDTTRKKLEDKRESLLNQNKEYLDNSISDIDNISNKEKGSLLSIEKEKHKLRKEADDVINETEIDEKTKKSLLKDIEENINKLEDKKKNIIDNAQKQETTQKETKSEVLPTENEKVQKVSPKADKTNENVNVKTDETEIDATGSATTNTTVNETTQTENTPTNEGTESNINTQEQGVQSKPSETVDKTTVKDFNPKGVKGKFDLSLDGNGTVEKIYNKKGREIKRWRHDKKTGQPLGENGNYTRILYEYYGTKTENQLKEERQQNLTKALDNSEPTTLYEKALDYFARGGTMKSQDAKSETGYSRSETKWVAKDSKLRPEEELPTIGDVAERLDLENSQEARNAIIEVLQDFKNREDVENTVISKYNDKQEQIKKQELDNYLNSLSEEEFALYEELKAEEEFTENLSDEMAVEYFKDQIAYYEESKKENEINRRSEQIGEATPTSNDGTQEGEGIAKPKETGQGEVNDDTQAQGVSLNKENNRDSALSKEGAVKQKNARQRAFKRFWNNTFSSTRGLDKKVVREIESLMGDLAAISSALEYEASQFAKMSKQILKQDKKNYNENLKKINDYLSGDTSVNLSFLKDQQKEQLDAFRGRIDNLSDNIIKVLNDKKKRLKNDEAIKRVDALIETIEGNKGKYMFRQYDAFSNDKYLDGLTGKYPNNAAKKRLDNAVEYVSKEEGITKEEAKTQILEYLDSLKGNNDFVSATATGKAKAPFLKRRKDIPEPIRELLGESKDPVKNYIATVLNMSKYIANIEYQSRLADALNKTGLSKDKIEPGYTKLIKSSEGWDLLQDIYVPDEVAESIEDLQPLDSIQDSAYRTLVQLAAVTKLGKTVLSPTTTARNLLSGIFLSLNNGFNPFRNPKRFVRAIQHSWGTKKTNTELKAENQRLIKLGIIKDGAVSREVLGILNDAQLPVDKILKKNVLEKFLDVMQKAYALGDDSYKAVGFYVWEQRYKDAGLSDADAEIAAADRVRNGFPTYSKIPKNIQKLRRIPLVGTFPSFAYEVWRTSFNNIRFIGQDIKAATTDSNGDVKPVKDWDKRRLLMAHQQATGMIIANSMAYALSSLSMALLGISDEEDETTKNMSAPWQKDSTNIYVGQEDGNYQVIDASAFFPSETMFKPVRILTEQREGRDINDRIKLSLKSATDAFLSTDIFMQTVMDLHQNKNGYGQEIYKGDNVMEGLGNDPEKIINYTLKQAGPGIYNNISEFARANELFPDYFGNKETSYKEYTNTEALMGLMGIRLSRINYVNGINSIAYDTKDKYQKARNETLSEIKSTKKMSDEDIQSLVNDYKDYNKEYHKQVILSVSGAKKQGIEKRKIEKALKNAGYSNQDINRIYMGQEPFLKPFSKTTFKRKIDKIDIGRFSNNKAKLKEVKENIANKAMLFNRYIYESNVKAEKS